MVIQEAGLGGFWIHRLLLAKGIESQVVDGASIAVDRRVCSMVRAPSPIPIGLRACSTAKASGITTRFGKITARGP
jgi:hypothetical protein